jgi:hypothetical protein
MNEQSRNENQPKVRRAADGGAEEPRPSVTRAESSGRAEQETPEKPSSASREARPTTDKGICEVESMLLWPFQATQRALDEWTRFFGRAMERNLRAAADLRACHSVAGVLRCERDLVQSNAEDWLQTSFAVFGIAGRKVAPVEADTATT